MLSVIQGEGGISRRQEHNKNDEFVCGGKSTGDNNISEELSEIRWKLERKQGDVVRVRVAQEFLISHLFLLICAENFSLINIR